MAAESQGARIARLRSNRSASQKDLAGGVNLPISKVRAWEAGEFEPSACALDSCARFLNVSTDYLLHGEAWDAFGQFETFQVLGMPPTPGAMDWARACIQLAALSGSARAGRSYSFGSSVISGRTLGCKVTRTSGGWRVEFKVQ